MARQINVNLDEDVEIVINGRSILRVNQVSDDKLIACYLYSDYFMEATDDQKKYGCVGEIMVAI